VLGVAGEQRGILPRALDHIFGAIGDAEAEADAGSMVHVAHVSYLEIYNEKIFDLLDASRSGTSLGLHLDPKRGTFVKGLTEEPVEGSSDALELMKRGAANRSVAATSMNRESSRSHTVFTLTLEARERSPDGITRSRKSCLHLIDLAGSERQKRTKAEGARLKEANAINTSLTVLGCVITDLAAAAKQRERHGAARVHIRYRGSKLTHLLKDALGGNSRTALIAAVSPSEDSMQETKTTLQFAQRAQLVRNRAVVNEDLEGNVAVLRARIASLQAQIRSAGLVPEGAEGDEEGAAAAAGRPAAVGTGRGMAVASEREAGRAGAAARALARWDSALVKLARGRDDGEAAIVASSGPGALRAALSLLADAAAACQPEDAAASAAERPASDEAVLAVSGVLAGSASSLRVLDDGAAALADALWRAHAAERESRSAIEAEQGGKEAIARLQRANEALKLRLRLADGSAGDECEEGDDGRTREQLRAEVAALRSQVSASPEAAALEVEVAELRAELEAVKAGEAGMWDGGHDEDGESESKADEGAPASDTAISGQERLRRYVRTVESRVIAAEEEAAVLREVIRAVGADEERLAAIAGAALTGEAADGGEEAGGAPAGRSAVSASGSSAQVLRRWLAQEAWRKEKDGVTAELTKATRSMHEARREAAAEGERACEADAEGARWKAEAEAAKARADAEARTARRLQAEAEAIRKEAASDTQGAVEAARERFERLAEQLESELRDAGEANAGARAEAEAAQKRATAAEAAAAEAAKRAESADAGRAEAEADARSARLERGAAITRAEGAEDARATAEGRAEAAAAAADRAREALAEAKKRVSLLEQDLGEARRTADEQRARARRVEFASESLSDDVESLEEQMSVYRDIKRKLQADVKVAELRAGAAEARAGEAERRLGEARSEAETAAEAAARGEEEVGRVRSALGAAKRAEAEGKEAEARAREAEARAEDAEGRAKEAEAARCEAQERATSADSAVAEALRGASEAREAQAAAELAADEAAGRVDDLEERADAAEREAAALREELAEASAAARAEVSRALDAADAATARAEERSMAVTRMRDELTAARLSLEGTTEALEDARAEGASARADGESVRRQLDDLRSAHSAQLEAAMERLVHARKEAEQGRQDANDAKAAADASETQCCRLRAQLAATRRVLSGAAGDGAGDGGGDASDTAARAESMAREHAEALETIESLNGDLVAEEERREELAEEAEALKKAVEELHRELGLSRHAAHEADVARREADVARRAAEAARDGAERTSRAAEGRQAQEEAATGKMGGLVERLQSMLATRNEEAKAAREGLAAAREEAGREARRAAAAEAAAAAARSAWGVGAPALSALASTVVAASEQMSALAGSDGARGRIAVVFKLKSEKRALKARVAELEAGGAGGGGAAAAELLAAADALPGAVSALRSAAAALGIGPATQPAAGSDTAAGAQLEAAAEAAEAQDWWASPADASAVRAAAVAAAAAAARVVEEHAPSALATAAEAVRLSEALVSWSAARASQHGAGGATSPGSPCAAGASPARHLLSPRPAGASTPLRHSAEARRARVEEEMRSPLQRRLGSAAPPSRLGGAAFGAASTAPNTGASTPGKLAAEPTDADPDAATL